MMCSAKSGCAGQSFEQERNPDREVSEQLREHGLPLIEAGGPGGDDSTPSSSAASAGVHSRCCAPGVRHWRWRKWTTLGGHDGAFGGVVVSTILNLFIPVLYLIIEGWREHGKVPGAAQR